MAAAYGTIQLLNKPCCKRKEIIINRPQTSKKKQNKQQKETQGPQMCVLRYWRLNPNWTLNCVHKEDQTKDTKQEDKDRGEECFFVFFNCSDIWIVIIDFFFSLYRKGRKDLLTVL